MDFGDLKRRLIQVNEEMMNIRENLYGNNIFEAIKCISNLDDHSLLDSFETEIDTAMSKTMNLPLKFTMNEVHLKNFNNELRKMVTMEMNEVKIRNEEIDAIKISSRRDNRDVEGMKQYFEGKFKNT